MSSWWLVWILAGCVRVRALAEPLPGHLAAPPVPVAAPPAAGDGFVREDVRFPCGEVTCAGWLYLPSPAVGADPVGALGGVVLAHGFAGQRELGLAPFAERFARAGYAVLVFDYRRWGASGGTPRYVVNTEEQVEDYRSALAWLRGHPQTDPDRMALWGTSLAGGTVLLAAHRDGHIQAIISQVPMTNGRRGGEIELSLRDGVRLIRLAFMDKFRSFKDEKPRLYVTALGEGFAFVPGPEAAHAAEVLVPEGSTWPNLVATDILLDFDEFRPNRVAGEIATPTLFVVGEHDRYVSNDATEQTAGKMPNARIEAVAAGHFDVYLPPVRDRVLELEVGFLEEHL